MNKSDRHPQAVFSMLGLLPISECSSESFSPLQEIEVKSGMGGQFIVGTFREPMVLWQILPTIGPTCIIYYVYVRAHTCMHVLTLCLVASQIDGVSIGLGTFTIPVDVVALCLVCVAVALLA